MNLNPINIALSAIRGDQFSRSMSLNLDFTNSTNTFDPRITYTGASARMYFDSTGTLKYAPMNLLTYSEDFSNAAWGNQNTTETLAVIAPPSECTQSWLLNDGVALAGHDIGQAVSTSVVAAATYTVSARFKDGDRRYCIVAASASTTSWASAKFDLQAGTAGSISQSGSGWTAVSSSISADSVAGWYVCTLTFVSGTTGTVTARCGMATDTTTFTASLRGLESYTGSNKLLYVAGAQFNQGELTDYIPTTSAAVYLPRSNAYQDHNPSTLAPLGFLIEEARTNSIRNNTMQGAVAGTPGTLPTNWVIGGSGTGTLTRTVVGSGTLKGIPYVDLRFSGITSTTNFGVSFDGLAQIVGSQGQVWTCTAFVALVAGSTSNLNSVQLRIDERTAAGTFLGSTVSNDLTAQLNSTLTRYVARGTVAAATTERVNAVIVLSFASGAAIDITLRIGLPQLELGAFATSPILTFGAAATRVADSASMTGAAFNSIWNQSEGTIVVGFNIANRADGTPADNRVFSANANTAQDRVSVVVEDGFTPDRIFPFVGIAGVTQFSGSAGSNGSGYLNLPQPNNIKWALAYKAADFAASVNGASPYTASSGSVPTCTQINIGSEALGIHYLNDHLQSLTIYRKRLPNSTLQALSA